MGVRRPTFLAFALCILVGVSCSDAGGVDVTAGGGSKARATTTTPATEPTTTTAPTTTSPPATPPAPPTSAATARATSPPRTGDATAPPSSRFGPRPPGSLSFAYEPGRSTWEGVSEGTTLRLQLDPQAPRSGEPVRFIVEAHHPDRAICALDVLFGDGADAQLMDATSGRAEFSHIYNKPGRQEFLYQAVVGVCGDHNAYPSMTGSFDVAQGAAAATSQGPAPPTLEIAEARAPTEPAGTGTLRVHAKGSDPDGYIHRFVVDWGDGSPPTSAPNAAGPCNQASSGWPSNDQAFLWEPYPEHTYASKGLYMITVTAVSAGCDGRDEQTATATMAYQW